MNNRFILVGSGMKSVFLDENNDSLSISHSRGIIKNNFEIFGYFDLNIKNVNKAINLYGGIKINKISDISKFDGEFYVIIATPDKYHYENIISVLKNENVKGILIEKPLSLTSKNSLKILELIKLKGIKCEVNYFRRFLPSFKKIKEKITLGEYGEFLYGRGIYDKGLFHNGSHLINLILYYFEDVRIVSTYFRKRSLIDNDYNYDFILSTFGKNIIVQSGNSQKYTIFELELYFEKKVIKIVDFGRKIIFLKPVDDIIPGYKKLNIELEIVTEYSKMSEFTISDFLNTKNYKNLEDAVETIKICEEVVNKYEYFNICL